MKKGIILGSLLLALPLVSAQNLPAPPIAFNGVKDLLNVILNGTAGGDYSAIMARFLIFAVLAIVLYKPSKSVLGNEKWGAALSVLVSIMAVRFFTEQMVRGLFLPYETLGVVLSVMIPFVLFEWFMISQGETFPKPFRTVGYFMMAGIFTGMWWFRWTDIGDLAYYYVGATALCIVALIFDGTFHKWFTVTQIDSAKRKAIYLQTIDLRKRMNEAIATLAAAEAGGNAREIEMAKEDLNNVTAALKDLKKEL